MTTTDIFIKTYKGDFVWLDFLLKSIKKFASGFRDVVIVSDDDGHKIPDSIVNIMPAKIFYSAFPKTKIPNCSQPIGYVWQQAVKLEWMKYTDADAVFFLDSDQMIIKPITPNNLITNNKYTWFYRDWKDADRAICWKKRTDDYLKIDSKYESMCVPASYVMTRNITSKFLNYVFSMYNARSIWETFMKANIEGVSEYNAMGNFILDYDENNEYNKQILTENFGITQYVLTSWSWGGLNSEDKIIRDSILNQ